MLKNELHILSNGNKELKQFVSVAEAIHPYVSAIHIREKQRTEIELNNWVSKLIERGIPREKLVMNTFYKIAGEWGLGGVQLPGEGPLPSEVKARYPNLRVGCSIHSMDEGVQREREAADYLIFGNVYETSCKPGVRGQGLLLLEELTKSVSIPVLAIGGINPNSSREVLKAGASGIVVMSGVMGSSHPIQQTRLFQSKLQGGV